jgi:hypothetical protein
MDVTGYPIVNQGTVEESLNLPCEKGKRKKKQEHKNDQGIKK